MSDYRFAIIGCGKIAPRHAEQISRLGKLVAVCDIIPGKADLLAKNYQCKAYYKVEDLLKEVKAPGIVSVCSPNYLHASHSIACIQRGFDVLCEKPLAISSADAREMIKAAEKSGRKLFVVKSTRYNPAVQALKKALDEGRLGKIFSFQLNCFWNRPVNYYLNTW